MHRQSINALPKTKFRLIRLFEYVQFSSPKKKTDKKKIKLK